MKINLRVHARTEREGRGWEKDLSEVLSHFTQGLEHDLFLVDARYPEIENVLGAIDRDRAVVFIVSSDAEKCPEWVLNGKADDVIITPFRMAEILSKFRSVESLLTLRKIEQANQSLSQVVQSLEESYRLAERVQKAALPQRFSNVKGLKVGSRYLAGEASGGDYFDILELESSQGSKTACVILAHANSYRLSSAILKELSEIIGRAEIRDLDPVALVSELQKKLNASFKSLKPLKHPEELSLCLGFISQSQEMFHYVRFGSGIGFYSDKSQAFQSLEGRAEKWTVGSDPMKLELYHLRLVPQSRLVFFSQGFVRSTGGDVTAKSLLEKFRNEDAVNLLNEVTYLTKSQSKEKLPAQDCTAIVIDLEARGVLKLLARDAS